MAESAKDCLDNMLSTESLVSFDANALPLSLVFVMSNQLIVTVTFMSFETWLLVPFIG
jgi:hypothetical protein